MYFWNLEVIPIIVLMLALYVGRCVMSTKSSMDWINVQRCGSENRREISSFILLLKNNPVHIRKHISEHWFKPWRPSHSLHVACIHFSSLYTLAMEIISCRNHVINKIKYTNHNNCKNHILYDTYTILKQV